MSQSAVMDVRGKPGLAYSFAVSAKATAAIMEAGLRLQGVSSYLLSDVEWPVR